MALNRSRLLILIETDMVRDRVIFTPRNLSHNPTLENNSRSPRVALSISLYLYTLIESVAAQLDVRQLSNIYQQLLSTQQSAFARKATAAPGKWLDSRVDMGLLSESMLAAKYLPKWAGMLPQQALTAPRLHSTKRPSYTTHARR